MSKSITNPATAPVFLATVMGVGIIAFHLFYAWTGFSLYRDQHLGSALVYARDGIDLLHPVIVGFNANGAPTPLEFPLWQAAASLPMRWFGEWFGWANIVSLLFFAVALYPVFKLGEALGNRITGWWTVALLLVQPIIWINAGRAGTDGTSIAAAIWFFYSGTKCLQPDGHRWPWVIATALSGALAATLKLPFMMAAGIALAAILFIRHRHEFAVWLGLGLGGLFSIAVFVLWSRHADACIAQAEFPFVDLRLSHNPDMVYWYFGDWNYRLNPANWIKGGWRALNGLFGSFALVGIPLAALGLRRAHVFPLALLGGALVVTAIFSHLVLHHQNYFLIYSLPSALLLASVVSVGWHTLERSWRWPKMVMLGGLITVTLLSVIQGLVGSEAVQTDPYPKKMADLVRKHTSESDKLLIVEGGWGGNLLFLSDREGLSIWTSAMLQKDDNLHRLKEKGFTKLVLVSDSPLLTALQVTNPGNANYQRRTYERALTEQSRGWHTVYQDADLLIKELP